MKGFEKLTEGFETEIEQWIIEKDNDAAIVNSTNGRKHSCATFYKQILINDLKPFCRTTFLYATTLNKKDKS